MGDSAGGALALTLSHQLLAIQNDNNKSNANKNNEMEQDIQNINILPKAVVTFSAFSDLTGKTWGE